jgi:SlyX protein
VSTDERLSRLEERLAWFEHHATEQDKAVLELAEELGRLRKEVLALRARAATLTQTGAEALPADERPPHY